MQDNAADIELLKAKLATEAGKENADINVIVQLSNDIAKLDNSSVRFSVDAGIINRLGKELVGRHETAVSELVKNAYDADSQEVKLIFENAWQPGGTLVIEDDGIGMTRDQLINGFMRLSSADKIHNPISPKYGRTRAGRKGIGRFATQRLGQKLTIITQTVDSKSAIKISIDWGDFEADKDLLTIKNQIEFIPKQKEEGTILIIQKLREGWSDAMIKRVFRYTSDLLQPFPLSKQKTQEEKKRIDPGFKSVYFRKNGDRLDKIIDEEQAFFNHALAEIEGYVLDDGQGCWSLKSKKLDFPEEVFLIGRDREDDKSKFGYIRDVHFKCYYFIYHTSLLPPQQLSFIREVAKEKGGIRMYRNGFRVLPYAERGNDWLRLDESEKRRIILPGHANNHFFGFVEITDKTGLLYEETSSREGLIENEAFTELSDFIYRCLVSAVLKIAELRGTKGKTSQKEWKIDEVEESVDDAISEIGSLIDEEEKSESSDSFENEDDSKSQRFKYAYERLKEFREQEKQKTKQLLDEINMLRVLAALGLIIGEFIHEVKRFLPAFHTDNLFLKKFLSNVPEAYERTLRLEQNLKAFTTYTSYFDSTISQNVLRELAPIEIRDVVSLFEEVIQKDIQRANITIHQPKYEDFDLFTTPMHRSEWASILFNLYTNSKKAIRRAERKGEIFIRCGRQNGNIFICFSDNGDGIPEENKSRIFEAFFTTSSAASVTASESDAIIGTGLGLKIVRDIIESYGGNISVINPEIGYSTTIKISVPANEN